MRRAHFLRSLLQRLIHRERVSFGMKCQAAEEQNDKRVLVRPNVPASAISLIGGEDEIVDVNSERNDGQLGKDNARDAKSGP
jgi:hypothetical protein